MKPLKVWKVLRKRMQDELADGHAHAPRIAQPLSAGGSAGDGDAAPAEDEMPLDTSTLEITEQLVQKCKDKKFLMRCTAFMEKTGNNISGDGISPAVLKRLHPHLNAAVTKMWSDALCSDAHKAVFMEFFGRIATTDDPPLEKKHLVEFFNMCFAVVGKVGPCKCVVTCVSRVCLAEFSTSTNELSGPRVGVLQGGKHLELRCASGSRFYYYGPPLNFLWLFRVAHSHCPTWSSPFCGMLRNMAMTKWGDGHETTLEIQWKFEGAIWSCRPTTLKPNPSLL